MTTEIHRLQNLKLEHPLHFTIFQRGTSGGPGWWHRYSPTEGFLHFVDLPTRGLQVHQGRTVSVSAGPEGKQTSSDATRHSWSTGAPAIMPLPSSNLRKTSRKGKDSLEGYGSRLVAVHPEGCLGSSWVIAITAGGRGGVGQWGATDITTAISSFILQKINTIPTSQRRQELGGARKDLTPEWTGLMCTREDQRYLSRVTQSGLESLLSSVSPMPPPFTMCLGGRPGCT